MVRMLSEAEIKGLNVEQLLAMQALIKNEIADRSEGGFVQTVLEYLREGADEATQAEIELGGGAIQLTFGADRWDNGWFYRESAGTLMLSDGTEIEHDFSDTVVADALTEVSEARRPSGLLDRNAMLVVDLRSGVVKHR